MKPMANLLQYPSPAGVLAADLPLRITDLAQGFIVRHRRHRYLVTRFLAVLFG